MIDRNQPGDREIGEVHHDPTLRRPKMDSPHGRDAVSARAVLIDAPLTPVSFSGASGYPAFAGDPPVADTGSEAAVRRLAFSIMISDADIQALVAGLFRVRIPTAMAHALNCYLWLGPDGGHRRRYRAGGQRAGHRPRA